MNLKKPPLAAKSRKWLLIDILVVLFLYLAAAKFFSMPPFRKPVQNQTVSAQVKTAPQTQQQSEAVSSAPVQEPPLEPLPAVQRYTIQRIGTYTHTSLYDSSQTEYVSVKFVGQNNINRYDTDSLWALARPGDVVVFTPSYSNRQVVWETAIEFVEHTSGNSGREPENRSR